MIHLWHDIAVGKDAPNVCTAVVEINSGCRNKFEIHKEYGVIKLDRVLQGSSIFPFNYGFFPQTYAFDDDPLDVLILGSTIIYPGCIVDVKPIGVIQMTDQGKVDSKIVAVAIGDISVSEYNEMAELPDYKRRELKRFFEEYKVLENKEVIVGEPETADKAKEIIMACSKRYVDEIVPRIKERQLRQCIHTQEAAIAAITEKWQVKS